MTAAELFDVATGGLEAAKVSVLPRPEIGAVELVMSRLGGSPVALVLGVTAALALAERIVAAALSLEPDGRP